MNAVFFGIKRAYYGTLRGTRGPLLERGLTAARYDLMKIVRDFQEMLQRDLRRVLGVAGATVSRMLKSLEELGLVERKPASDRRCRVVTLTSAGTDALANVDAWIDKDWGSQETVTSPNLRIEGPHGRWYDLFYCGYATGFARRTEPAWLLYAQFFSPYGLWHPQD